VKIWQHVAMCWCRPASHAGLQGFTVVHYQLKYLLVGFVWLVGRFTAGSCWQMVCSCVNDPTGGWRESERVYYR
jgi:hypothetical protein